MTTHLAHPLIQVSHPATCTKLAIAIPNPSNFYPKPNPNRSGDRRTQKRSQSQWPSFVFRSAEFTKYIKDKFARTKMRRKEGTKIELQREICQILFHNDCYRLLAGILKVISSFFSMRDPFFNFSNIPMFILLNFRG